jgi:CheY-like chemotaxis protein
MSGNPSDHGSGPDSRARLLIVDDDAAIGRAISRIVRADHDVTVLTSGREAIERIAAGERYHAILCDLMMPDVTGMEVYERIAAIDPASARRMIFLSGGAFTRRAEEFFLRIENRRVDKPFDRATLLAALATVLRTEVMP